MTQNDTIAGIGLGAMSFLNILTALQFVFILLSIAVLGVQLYKMVKKW